MTVYENTAALGLLGTHPRAVYRLTIARSPGAALSYASGLLRWRDVVLQVIGEISGSGFGIPLGGPLPSDNDRTAIIEVRAVTAPGTADSVGDLVRAAERGSMSANVVRVERLPPVPATGTAEAAARDASRQAEQARAEAERGVTGVLASLRAAAGRAGALGAIGLAAGVVIVAALLIGPKARRVGQSSLWN